MKKIFTLLITGFVMLISWETHAGVYYDSIPQICNLVTGGTEIVNHNNAQFGAINSGTLDVYFTGDLDLSTEYVTIYTENGGVLGTLQGMQCGNDFTSFTIPVDSINSWSMDGIITFTYTATSSVNNICTGGASFCITPVLTYNYVQGYNNIGIVSLDTPSVACPGPTPVVVTVGNFGMNQVDTFSIAWEINGVPQPSQTYYILLDTNGGSNPTTAQVNLGTINLTTTINLKIWTYNPNNVPDTINQNDTLNTIISPSLSGTFYIGGPMADYASFNDAVNALNNFGVCGPVTFIVHDSTFNEQITLTYRTRHECHQHRNIQRKKPQLCLNLCFCLYFRQLCHQV
ncbi:MAG: hypothetical protein KatS3mg034_1721 [Vicingaceae bacterium]|nr:MAG: hypothetical protein KatS3mg034_1721 [Vicingaceae bacterium]